MADYASLIRPTCSLSRRRLRRSKIACAREIALDPLGRHCFGIQAEPVAKGLVPRKPKCPKIEIVAVENNLCVRDASSHLRIAFTRSAETKLPSQPTSKRHCLPGRQMACPSCQDIDVAQPRCQRRRCIACAQTNHFAVHEEIRYGKQNACVGSVKGHVQWRTGGRQSGSKRRRGRPRRSPICVYADQKSCQHHQKASSHLGCHPQTAMRTHWGFCLHFLLLVYSWFGVALTLGFLRAERSDESAFNAEYRPNRTHGVTARLDSVVHASGL
jgi:hypothetical protein